MKVFCHCIREAILETFHLDVDVYGLKKKGLVHIAFKKALTSCLNFKNIIQFASDEWRKRKMFFTNYEMIYPILIPSLKWKYDFVFFKKVGKK